MRHRGRHRWIALLALFGLLFQQVAMATYVCPIEQTGRTHIVADKDLAQPPCHRDMQADAVDDTDPVRCQQHCHPTVPAADHVSSLTVPPGLPAAYLWLQPAQVSGCSTSQAPESAVDPHAGAPPLSIQFCSFQI